MFNFWNTIKKEEEKQNRQSGPRSVSFATSVAGSDTATTAVTQPIAGGSTPKQKETSKLEHLKTER